ncbi:hypothetical protein SAMN02799624_06510 [Paenibacillus sp. UNC496MF]|uniref:hypothetical protein n=1 Tax=Paenibacillus sp. UNC496MF TaxID=1502753 RepID=UPI0008E04298|nr:hypothetical protein [Paenibacillus sp. UNC496MF]SFJ90345.1 hypothetical protein SAMN02799624_06510 [Paenibacillus sp. UNC496MF]
MWKITGKVAAAVGKLAAAALLISFLSIWTTGYVVNSYVETLLKQFHIPLEQQPFALSGLWGEMWGADPGLKDGAKSNAADRAKETGDPAAGSGDASTDDGTSKAGSGDASDAGGTSGGTDKTGASDAGSGSDDGSVDAFGDLPQGELSDIGGGTGPKGNSGAASGQDSASSGDAAGDAAKDGVAMSTDEINATKSQISDADKEKLFGVMNKLPQEAWQQISTYMENGLTAEEMTKVKQLMAQYLDRTEYDEMSSILSKY